MMYLGDQAVGLLVNTQIKTDSGILTLPETMHTITVNHNLGEIPTYGYIYMEPMDSSKIPFGSCVSCAYGKLPYTNMGSVDEQYSMRYVYTYKHSTSGNFLQGTWYAKMPTSTVFYFDCGNNDWPALDVDGNPIKYYWIVGKFTKEVTPNA